ncbi:MAG: energy transducer TonB, partial [Terriglobia bacterium]
FEVPGILVTPAGPVPPGPVIVGLESGTGMPGQPGASDSPAAGSEQPPRKSPKERAQAMLAAIRAGRGGDESAVGRRVYTTYIYLPDLTSQSSTWLLRFAERNRANPARPAALAGEGNRAGKDNRISAPQVVKKADPCYPADAHWERVEGTVALYGVIRADGGVEDIAVVRGVEARLDKKAAEAFARSRFAPARKNGRPIAIEALVEIPFRLALCF